MASIESYQLLLVAVAACEDKKAEDIRILSLDPTESGLSDYFLICNGTNSRQNVAITDEIEIRLKRDFGTYPHSVEGRREGEWILMDYVDFIVHVFSPEKREYYGLERLRKTATSVSPDELNEELKAEIREQTGAKRSRPAADQGATTPIAAKREGTAAPKKPGKKSGATEGATAVPPKKVAKKTAASKQTPGKKAVGGTIAAKRTTKAGKKAQ